MYRSAIDVQQVLRIFPPQQSYALDSIVSDQINQVFDRIGWRAFGDVKFSSFVTVGSTTVTIDTNYPVPHDKTRVVLAGHLDHDDVAAHSLCWSMQIEFGGNVHRIPFGTWISSTAVQPRPLPFKSLVYPPGSLVMGVSDPAVPIGFNFELKYIFVDLPIGEYIHSL